MVKRATGVHGKAKVVDHELRHVLIVRRADELGAVVGNHERVLANARKVMKAIRRDLRKRSETGGVEVID